MRICRGFGFTLRRELGKFGKLATFAVMVTVFPLMSLLFLAALFENGVPRDLPVAVVDNDATPLSRQAARMIDAGQFAKLVASPASVDEARGMMLEGRIDAVVVLPRDMERSVMRGERVSVPVFINGSNLLVGSLLEKDLSTTLQTFSTGIEIQKLQTKGMTAEAAYVAAMPVTFDKHILFNPYTSYAYYIMPGFMSMMLFFFAILSTVFSIGLELKRGTAFKWLSGAGHSMGTALVGKMLPYTLWFWLLSFVMMYLLYVRMDMPMNGSFAMLVIANFLLIAAYQWMGVLIVTATRGLRLALSISAGYSVLAFSFSGLTYPFIGMNEVVATLGKVFFPFTHYLDIFVDQSMRGAPVWYSLGDVAVLCLFVLAGMASIPFLRVLCKDQRQWGRL